MSIPETSTTATTALPFTAGASLSSLTDPVALGLADYFAYWLNTSLNAQLAVMPPHTATAVPTAARYAYDPMGIWVRNTIPAIYVWWKSSGTRVQYSTLRDMIPSTYGIMYVSDERVAPAGAQHMAGLQAVVDVVLRTANDRGFHPDYGYGSDPDGTPIYLSLGLARWNFTRLEAGALVPVPATSSNPGGAGEGGIVRYFPAVVGEIEVWKVIGQPIPRDPEDVLRDCEIDIRTNEQGDIGNVVSIMERVLPEPDGSEQP